MSFLDFSLIALILMLFSTIIGVVLVANFGETKIFKKLLDEARFS